MSGIAPALMATYQFSLQLAVLLYSARLSSEFAPLAGIAPALTEDVCPRPLNPFHTYSALLYSAQISAEFLQVLERYISSLIFFFT